MSVHITQHAAERFIERVNPALSIADAKAEIRSHERAIIAAADFGCSTVILARRVRLVLDGKTVVTVLGAQHYVTRRAAQ